MSEYAYNAYCDICKHASPKYNTAALARGWRDLHFESVHEDNPLKKTNCRIQRHTVETPTESELATCLNTGDVE